MSDEKLYGVLRYVFNGSRFLHGVGAGDEQALELVMNAVRDVMDRIRDEAPVTEFGRAFVAGALMSRALCDLQTAWDAAEELIIDEEWEDV